MAERVYAIHSDEECERLDAQALLAPVSDHLRHLHLHARQKILDAGCGSGSMARAIAAAEPRAEVVGIDLRETYIDYARRRAEREGLANLSFETGDVRKLPFADASFDLVWTKYLLQWVADPMAAVREFFRVLKPGGVLVSCNIDGFAVTHEPVDPGLQPITEYVVANLVDSFIGRKMAGMAQAAGFVDLSVEMEVDRVFTVIGKIDAERRKNLEIQWSAARNRTIELLGSPELADAFVARFLGYQDRADTATYCTLYVVTSRKP
jgi:ubiquinone/menaquinone biosynthesis C-methylase UbiE